MSKKDLIELLSKHSRKHISFTADEVRNPFLIGDSEPEIFWDGKGEVAARLERIERDLHELLERNEKTESKDLPTGETKLNNKITDRRGLTERQAEYLYWYCEFYCLGLPAMKETAEKLIVSINSVKSELKYIRENWNLSKLKDLREKAEERGYWRRT